MTGSYLTQRSAGGDGDCAHAYRLFTALTPTEQKLTPTAAGPNELIFYYTEDQEIDFKEQLTGKSVAIVCVTPKVDCLIYYTPDSKSLTKTAPLTRQVTVTSERFLLCTMQRTWYDTLKAGQPANVTWTATWNAGTRTWNVSVSKRPHRSRACRKGDGPLRLSGDRDDESA